MNILGLISQLIGIKTLRLTNVATTVAKSQSSWSLEQELKALRGSIPPEIGSVSKLTHLNLSQNYLSGELPLSLTNLTQLVKLDISFNQMSGSIPSTIGLLTSLTRLHLQSNQIVEY